MSQQRIQVYADSETKRRIELAAAKHNVAITLYCLEAIRQQLAEDDVLEQEKVEIPVSPVKEADYITNLRNLREAILADRGGQPFNIDIAAFVEQVRAERDYELTGLR